MEQHLAAPSAFGLLPERSLRRLGADRSGGAENAATLRLRGALAPAAALDDAPVWSALLGSLPSAPDLAVLNSLVQVRQVGQGHTVISRSSTATTLVALRSGEVALGLRTADGTFRTERIVRGPAWLDQSSAWVRGAHAMDAVAQSPATVLELPRAALELELAQHPELAQCLIQGLAREVQALTVNTHELMHKDAPARLAQWLHQRCEALPGQPNVGLVRLHERKRDVASQLAITPETLSRLMRSFTRQGVIEVSGYTLRVLDIDALGKLAAA